MAKKKTKPDPYAAQAANAALVRYGPEGSVLAQLLRDAEDRRDTALRQATSGRDYAIGRAEEAAPAIDRAYSTASQAVTPAFAASGGTEAQALAARMAEAQAQAQAQLQDRRVSAATGATAARGQALRDYASDRGKVTQRILDLAQERGAFTAQTIADLKGADAQAKAAADELNARLGQSERNSIRSSGYDPDTGQPIPGGKADPNRKGNGGAGWASQAAQSGASDTINNALSWAKKLKDAGVPRGDAAKALLTGADPQPVYRTVKLPNGQTKQERVLNPDGTQKTTPAVPQIDSQLYLSAALDMAYDRHLSARNQKLLHERGIQLEPLGLTTLGEYRRRLRAALHGQNTGNRYGGVGRGADTT